MRSAVATILALGLMIILASCGGTAPASGPERSAAQAEFERKVSVEISDYGKAINRLSVPAEAQNLVDEAEDALAVAQARLKDLKEAQPKDWEKTKVFAVIGVEKLRKAYAEAKAATQAPPAAAAPQK
jgi:hypothetical protein